MSCATCRLGDLKKLFVVKRVDLPLSSAKKSFAVSGSWAILQLILGKVAAISLQLFLVIVAAIFGQSCSIFLADLQLISYD